MSQVEILHHIKIILVNRLINLYLIIECINQQALQIGIQIILRLLWILKHFLSLNSNWQSAMCTCCYGNVSLNTWAVPNAYPQVTFVYEIFE